MLTIEELEKTATEAMFAAVDAHGRDRDPQRASEFGRRGRVWERLVDAATEACNLLKCEQSFQPGPPPMWPNETSQPSEIAS